MKFKLFTVSMVLAAVAAGADIHEACAADAAAMVSAKRALQAGFDAASVPQMKKARAQFELLSQLEPKSAPLHYWVAFANWRLAPFVKKELAAGTLQATIDQCEFALKLDEKFAEAAALKAMTEGMMIRYKPAMGMVLGPKSAAGVARAREQAPDNPRVWLMSGIVVLHMPSFVGGGADRALEQLQKSRQLFEAHAAEDSTGIDWGHDDILVWLGQAAAENNQHDKAVAFYEEALRKNPGSAWAKSLLEQEKHPQVKEKS